MYEPISVEIDRAHGGGNYRPYSLYFVGRPIRMVESGHTKMMLYEWAELGCLFARPGMPLSSGLTLLDDQGKPL